MLILHAQHPRSIRFSATEVRSGLRALSGSGRGSYANEAERLAGKLVERLSYDRIGDIFEHGLHGYLNEVLNLCGAIGGDIARTYFYYAVVA
jgi:uncharacterized alpha-E superfamily protein